jgi:hypothetical protein
MTQISAEEIQALLAKGPYVEPPVYFPNDRDEGFRKAEEVQSKGVEIENG